MFRGACDPVLIASRTPPDRVDKAAIKNWLIADYEIPRKHPYSKPPAVIEYVLARVCGRGDTVLDPFAGSGPAGQQARTSSWTWSGRAPTSTRPTAGSSPFPWPGPMMGP
jgi:hypothetical protein